MEPTIGVHAKGQARDRGITEEGIKYILSQSPAVFVLSNHDPTAVIVLGRHEGKVWGVVLNIDTHRVITVRRASKKERRFYEEETKH
jgi:uncharacterized DUF497 family protein